MKVIHLTEIRRAVNAMRTAAGLTPASFTDPTPVAGTIVRAVHITDARTALDAARSTIGLTPLVYTDQTLTPLATPVKALHFANLRAGTQ